MTATPIPDPTAAASTGDPVATGLGIAGLALGRGDRTGRRRIRRHPPRTRRSGRKQVTRWTRGNVGGLSAAFAGALLVPLVGVLALAPAAGASAHDFLVQSSPAANSVQTTPIAEVSLTFNDRVLDLTGDGSSALAQVIGPKGSTSRRHVRRSSIGR